MPIGSFRRVLLWDGGGGIGSGVIDRYAARAAVGDDDGPHIGRDASEAGVFSGTNGGDLRRRSRSITLTELEAELAT